MEEISVYPNPFRNEIHVNGTQGNNYTYELLSIDGKLIQKGSLNASTIQTTDLIRGLYLLKLNDGVQTKEMKMIKH